MKAGKTLYEDAEPYIFISYRHTDSGRVFPLLDAMRERGYRVWYDADIQAGERWTNALATRIEHCAVFLPFLSHDYDASRYCNQEIGLAFEERRTIIPVWLTNTQLSTELKMLLNRGQGFSLASATSDAFLSWLDRQAALRPCRDATPPNPLVTNGNPVEPTPYFVGREDRLKEIETAFREEAAIVNLYGMGGIGKSEICRKFFRDRASALFKRVGWLTWRGTLQNTFYAQFRDIEENNAERYLNLALEYVKRVGRDLLLVIDNADDMTEAQAKKLMQLQCDFLVTSRGKQEYFHSIHAGALPLEQCRILYRRALLRDISVTDDSPEAALDEILRLAACHTLAAELLAKTQRAEGLSAAELLAQLQESGFDLSGEDIKYLHNPETALEDADAESPFIEHMSRIFDLSQLRDVRKGAEALRVLQGMSLLSPNTPIAVKTVKKWLDLPNLNGLNKAADTGWLDETIKPDGARFVSIHPVIAAVVRRTSPPDADYTDTVAGRLEQAMDLSATEVFTEKLPILKHAVALHCMVPSLDLQTENGVSQKRRTKSKA